MIGGVKGNQLSGNATSDGDIAGGDIYKNTIHVNQSKDASPLRKKIEQLKSDCLHDPDFSTCIKQLNHYLNPVNPDEQRALKAKLEEADRADEVYEAEELKEEFAKILVKDNLSEQAQDAYVHILGKIKTLYESKVKPLMKEGAPLSDIESNILYVIEVIYEDLSGTILEYDYRQIKGMLYFLTGNCHIDWKY
ncbi:MAG TPA: hypothetical protein PLK94_00500 [Alphaproteobacteria bacterium]|nr:hypothetical protein [Alphaproteobacteria bacterium]HOO49745.1 hypothetical protein [Alphaproteobacteria bacterium]